MTEPNVRELAQQGDPQAIASLLNEHLEPQAITATTHLNDGCLEVILEAATVPDRYEFVDFVRSELTTLEPASIRRVKVDGRKKSEKSSAWSQEFGLEVGSYSMLTFPGEPAVNPPQPQPETHHPIPAPASATSLKQPVSHSLDGRLRTTFMVVGFVTAILAISIGVFVNKQVAGAGLGRGNVNENVEQASADPFQEAVNQAMRAAKTVQSATSQEDWLQAANEWEEAIRLMKEVPRSHPNHALAQKKASEYQKNLKYARESAQNRL